MKEKYYEFTSVTIMSAILTILGMILLIGKSKAYHHLIDIVILIIWLNSLRGTKLKTKLELKTK